MRVEVTIAKEKVAKMPKGSMDALREELTKRLKCRYSDIDVIVKAASNDGMSLIRPTDKDKDKAYVSEILQETWESADDWFY
jgi:DNA-damage-inducible protein I